MRIEELFSGTMPSDVIVVTRSTKDNHTDYSPLPAAARTLVYEAIKAFLLLTSLDIDKVHAAEETEKQYIESSLEPIIEELRKLDALKLEPGAKKPLINRQIDA